MSEEKLLLVSHVEDFLNHNGVTLMDGTHTLQLFVMSCLLSTILTFQV